MPWRFVNCTLSISEIGVVSVGRIWGVETLKKRKYKLIIVTNPSQDKCNSFLHNEGLFSERAEHHFFVCLCGSGDFLELAQYLKSLFMTAE